MSSSLTSPPGVPPDGEHTAEAERADLLDLLRAVHEAIAIPYPATVGGTEAHDRILNDRVMHTVIALNHVLEGDPLGIAWTTAYLRDRLGEHPPAGYVTSEQARAALAQGKDWMDAVRPPAAGGDDGA